MTPVTDIVFFDLGDVVCRFQPQPRLHALAARLRKPAEELDAMIWQSGLSADADAGRLNAGSLCAEVNRRTGSSLSISELADIWRLAFVLNPEVYQLALRVNTQCGLLTNNAELLRQALLPAMPELQKAFEPILFSYEFAAAKPDPLLFTRVQTRTGVDPARLMLIDDSQRNISAAANAGWQTIAYRNPAQLAADLAAAGLI